SGSLQFQILGTFGDDTITGSSRLDMIKGGPGNDTIDGGLGSAAVAFGGSRDTYSFERIDGATTTWVVRDLDAVPNGDEGTDTVRTIASFVFENGATSVSTVNLIGSLSDVDNVANSVVENSANGTLVGIQASATDPNADIVTYSLTNSA